MYKTVEFQNLFFFFSVSKQKNSQKSLKKIFLHIFFSLTEKCNLNLLHPIFSLTHPNPNRTKTGLIASLNHLKTHFIQKRHAKLTKTVLFCLATITSGLVIVNFISNLQSKMWKYPISTCCFSAAVFLLSPACCCLKSHSPHQGCYKSLLHCFPSCQTGLYFPQILCPSVGTEPHFLRPLPLWSEVTI